MMTFHNLGPTLDVRTKSWVSRAHLWAMMRPQLATLTLAGAVCW